MKTGRTFDELVTELERQQNAKRDFLVPSDQLQADFHLLEASRHSDLLNEMISDRITKENQKRHQKQLPLGDRFAQPVLMFPMDTDQGPDMMTFPLTKHAHNQLAFRLDIPRPFYTRLMIPENADLWQRTVNHFLKQSTAKRLIRTLDGTIRADLSDAYRDLDNWDLIQAVVPPLIEAGCQILSCDVTDHALYLKALSPDLEGEIGLPSEHKWHTVNGGIAIKNNEIGAGSLVIETLLNVRACSNLMWTGQSFRKAHIGRRAGMDLDEAREFFSDRTRQLDDAAFFAKAGDIVKGALSHEAFQNTLTKMQGATESKPIEDPVGAVEVAAKHFGWTDGESRDIRNTLIQQARDHGFTKWGLSQAVTQVAQRDDLTYDRATELEIDGGKVIELPKRTWEEFASAIAA